MLHSIICSINQVSPRICHPSESNWEDIDHISELKSNDYLEKICMSVSRNIEAYPFVPLMTLKQLESLEKEVKSSLKTSSGLTGVFYSLSTMPSDVKMLLQRSI